MTFFIFRKLGRSFKIAFSGLFFASKHEVTFRTGLFISLFVIFFVFYFPLSYVEKSIIFLCIFGVLGMELMNTQIEKMADLIDENINPRIKVIKDLSAGAVLLMVINSAIIAYFIFWPYLLSIGK